MNRNVIIIAGVIVSFVAVIVFAAAGPSVPRAGTAGRAAAQPAPDFALQDLNGRTVRLADLRGKAVVVNFWATWCPPCRHEIPWFVELQKTYGPQGLEVVGISMDESGAAAVKQFAREMNINYTVLMGNADVAMRYGGVRVLPTTFYIGRDGSVIEAVPGLIGRGDVEELVKAALAKRARTSSASRS